MKQVMDKVIDQVTKKNAEADLILTKSKSLKMSSQRGEINEYKVSSSQILGVRVIKDGRVGISYTESLDNESLDLLVKQALQNAEMSEPNANEGILKLSGHGSDEKKYAEKDVDIAHKTKMALELETEPKRLDSRVVAVPYNSYSENETESFYLNSNGRSTSYADKNYYIVSSALMDENGKKANFYDFHMAHTYEELQWKKIIENSMFHSSNLLTEKALPTGKYNVQFKVDELKSLFECFSNFYSSKSAIDKVNPWATKIGEEVISKDLSIDDEPLYKDAFRPTKFDDEGVERKPLSLIKDGVLKSFYHNSKTAKHFNTQSTGHASRGPASSLNVGGTYLVVNGKNKKPVPQKYLEVIQMDGLGSGANRVTGEFSVAIKGYVWENGQRSMTFGNITLSGNLIELLKNVEVVGDKLLSSTDQSFFTVPLMFHGLSVAGS